MNSIVQLPYIRNGKRWYFLSVFYAKECWADLIINIMNFYRSRTGLFSSYLFTFSKERGDHLQVTFASFDENKDYSNEIQDYFQKYIDYCPSDSMEEFPYGKVLWCNYPNNSLAWNHFQLPIYSDQYVRFHQQTMRTALKLMGDDFSEETIFSVGLYLFTKALGCIDNAKRETALSKILYEASTDNSYDRNLIQKTLLGIDSDEVRETIESYVNEDTNEYILELTEWLKQTGEMLNVAEYNIVCHFICKVLGLTGVSHIIIVELLYKNLTSNTSFIRF